MGLPFDLEDVVGVALADVLRRAALVFGCVLGAPVLTGFAVASLEVIVSQRVRGFGDDILHVSLWLAVAPFTSVWGVLYIPTALASIFYMAKAESVTARAFVTWVGALCLLGLLCTEEFVIEMLGVAVLVAGLLGSLLWFAKCWDNKQAIDAEQHLMGLRIENDLRRQEMRNDFGTDVAGGDFAQDEKAPADEVGRGDN